MRSIHLGLYALFTSAVLMVSCAEDELIENNHHLTSSETINFDAIVEWPKDYMDSRSATSSLKRVESPKLRAEEGNETLPMGVYVQDGIYPTSMPNPESRGAVITQDQLASFNVWATLNKAENVEGGAIEYFSNVEYTKGNEGVFSSSGKVYYWPGEGPTIDFVAVGNAPESGFTAKIANNEVTSFEYIVDQDATKQNDIVLATAPNIAGDNDQSVPLDFKHILSAVNVKIGTEMTPGTVKSITFKNIYSKGVYNVEKGIWENLNTPISYTVTFKDDGVAGNTGYYTDGENTEEVVINDDNATLMMIPQTLADIPDTEKVEIIVKFHYSATDQTKDLTASLDGQAWAMGKTTNYLINVSPDFTLSIEEESVPIADCHYDTRVITIKNEHSTVDWTLSSDVDWVKFRIMPDDYETNIYKDYWVENHTVTVIERYIDTTVDNFEPVDVPTTTSYPLSEVLNGNGTTKVLVYFYENVSNEDRVANIFIKDKNDNVLDQILMQQYAPLWKNDIAYERIEEDKALFPWGFASTRTVVYSYPNIENVNWGDLQWLWDVIVWAKDIPILRLIARPIYNNFLGNRLNTRGEVYQQFYSLYINGQTNGFATISPSGGNGTTTWGRDNAWSVTLNYSVLNSINATSQSGLTNTNTILSYTGGSTGSDAETWLINQNMVRGNETNTNDATTIPQTAVYQAIKKNSWVSSTTTINITSRIQDPETKEYHNVYEPGNPINNIVLSSSGIQWFLPSSAEIATLLSTACDEDNSNNDEALLGTYWTSTSATGINSVMYKADGTTSGISRKETLKIRAARMKP